MDRNLVFLPMLAQILLTVTVFVWLGIAKSKALKLGQVDLEKRALHTDAWPDHVLKISNNINNQFETPVLFYALVLMLWALNAIDAYAMIFACGYVVTRVIHLYIHTGSNIVPLRRRVFTLGIVFLLLLALLGFKAILAPYLFG